MITKVGDLDFLESGSAVVHAHLETQIFINPLTFIFKFKNNPETKEDSILGIPEGNVMTIEFTNYNSGLGLCNTEPLKVGFIKNRDLFLNYAIYSFGEPTSVAKLLHYTFLLGGQREQ